MKRRLHISTDPDDPDARDTSWRVAAIYRCCVRYGMEADEAKDRMREIFAPRNGDSTVDIWFRARHMDQAREDYQQRVAERTSSGPSLP